MNLTPMMAQYHRIKREHPNEILLFRMGDFYETFYEDAKIISKVLGITLTSRNHGKTEKVPLAGVPYHAVDTYIARLINAGYKVAVCDQVEDPKLAKGIVKREVTEVITPGTILKSALLDDKRNNYLVAITSSDTAFGLSVVDLSTGDFMVTEIDLDKITAELQRINPAELLVPTQWYETHRTHFIFELLPNSTITPYDDWYFTYDSAYQLLTQQFQTVSLDGFGCEDLKMGISAAGAILSYLNKTQRVQLTHIIKLQRYSTSEFMLLDANTQRTLELTQSIRGGSKEGTLLSVIDRTKTAMGGRLIRRWLHSPLLNVDQINARLNAIEELINSFFGLTELLDLLSEVSDLERLISRISCKRATPRDLIALKNTLMVIPNIKTSLAGVHSTLLTNINTGLEELPDVIKIIDKSITDEPPITSTEGGVIKPGYHQLLDELRNISREGKNWILRLQSQERERTKIASLKVRYNKVFGYYIEVTKPNLHLVPKDYIRKQTIATGERFITPELKEYESKVLGAEEKIIKLEHELFIQIRDEVGKHAGRIQSIAKLIAELDVLVSLSIVAKENDYVKPVVNTGDSITIVEGRHPVVEKLLDNEPFVPNDTKLDNNDNQILIITGPNMAGKSTYLRQVALNVLLAQMGSFVPAKHANIGVVDRIFTRVGASDNLAKGQSTFLIEMNETANILNNATPRSLILLDEIGRGTSTFDGLSIAWAVTEYLHNSDRIAAKTLFATHYHELTELAQILQRVKNYNIAVREWGDRIIFLRKIVEGGVDRSYGIQVARLAGLPNDVIERAKEVLSNLESQEFTTNKVPKLAIGKRAPRFKNTQQLDMFSSAEHPVITELKSIDITRLTPLEALNKLDEIKRKFGCNNNNSKANDV